MASHPTGAAISSSYAAPMMARIVRSVPPPIVGYDVSFRRPATASKWPLHPQPHDPQGARCPHEAYPMRHHESIRATTRVYEELWEGITAIREKNP